MSRENLLFSIIGVLLGYIIGFTFVVYVNQNQSSTRAGQSASKLDGQSDGELPPDHPQLPMNSVKDQGTLRQDAEQAENAAREAPQDFDAQSKAATLSEQAGRYEEAIDSLTRANQIRPGDYSTLVNLGNVNFEWKHYEVAEQWYKEALAKKPDDVDVRADLGLTYFVREPSQTDKAIAEFRRVLERKPDHLPTLHNLTLALTKKGDFAEADRTLARLEKANPKNQDLPRLRETLEKARKAAGSPTAGAGSKTRVQT
ncbi:MAG: tetratricopeptide repeat protein [Acidobacteria bacterium]|nr:tetratricopeptide repeat protein [Acidobacteriota bacterium]